jgi:uncharacterized protein (DUF2147 family)
MFVALSALVLALQAATSVAPLGVVGLWRTAGDEGLVRIEACSQAICGRAVDDAPPQTKFSSRDPSLHDQAVDGQLIMKLKPLGPGRWGDGWIQNPDNGKSYKASITLSPDGRLRLKGCLVVPLCRTQTWTRASSVASRAATTQPW